MTPANEATLAAVPPFRERLPWLGADLQTIRNLLMPNPSGPPGGGERLLLPVSEGDHLAARLDQPEGAGKRPLIVLVHGLTGSEASINVRAAAERLYAQGWSVLRVNLRGAGPSRPLSRGRYHAGRTEDLAAALHALPPGLLQRGIVLVGHSLGGNLILKFLGEGARDLPVLGGAVVSTPLDLAETCARMLTPRNFVYQRYLLSQMKREALAAGAVLTATQRATIAKARNVFEFDDRFVAHSSVIVTPRIITKPILPAPFFLA